MLCFVILPTLLRARQRPIDAIEGAASQLDDAVLSASASNAAPNAALAITRAGQPASASGEPDSSESSTLSKRLRVRTTPMQPTDAATLESVAQKLRYVGDPIDRPESMVRGVL